MEEKNWKDYIKWEDNDWLFRWGSTLAFVLLIILFRMAKAGFDLDEVFTVDYLMNILPFTLAYFYLSKSWASAGKTEATDEAKLKDEIDDNNKHYLDISKNRWEEFKENVIKKNHEHRANRRLIIVINEINVLKEKNKTNKQTEIDKLLVEKKDILSFIEFLKDNDKAKNKALIENNFDINLYPKSNKEIEPIDYFSQEVNKNKDTGRFDIDKYIKRETIGAKLATQIIVPIIISFNITKNGFTGDAFLDLAVQLVFLSFGLYSAYKVGKKAMIIYYYKQLREDNIYLNDFRNSKPPTKQDDIVVENEEEKK